MGQIGSWTTGQETTNSSLLFCSFCGSKSNEAAIRQGEKSGYEEA